MAQSNCDIEVLLLSEEDTVEGDDVSVSKEVEAELESLLAGEEEDLTINLAPSLSFTAVGVSSISALLNQKCNSFISSSHQNGSSTLTNRPISNRHIGDRRPLSLKSTVAAKVDSDEEDDDSAAAAILAAVLTDCDGEDGDDFSDLIENKENTCDRYLFELERAGRKERRYLLDEHTKRQSGPLCTSVSVPQSPAAPQGRFAYLALDSIEAACETELVTAAHFNSSCICIGTDDGLITVFRNNETVCNTLRLSDLLSPVTAIDTSSDKQFLVSGYESGMIALWNILDGPQTNLLLMFIDDLHTIPLKYIKINQRPIISNSRQIRAKSDSVISFLSSDDSGATHRIRVKKSMFSKYSYESECLLNGSKGSSSGGASGKSSGVGMITSLSVLPPLPVDMTGMGVSGVTGGTGGWADMEVMAFSTSTKTFLVQLKPKVMILHRWPVALPSSVAAKSIVPASESYELEREKEKEKADKGSESDGESDKSIGSSTNNSITSSTNRSFTSRSKPSTSSLSSLAPKIPMSLDWVWSGTETDSGQRSPLLLRSCGPSLQVLSLTLTVPLLGPDEGAGAKGKGKGTITFNLSEYEVDNMCVFSARWIDGDCSRIAAICETHLLVLSYPAFKVLESAALVPEMVAILRATGSHTKSSSSGKSSSSSGKSIGGGLSLQYLGFESYGEDFYFFPIAAVPVGPSPLPLPPSPPRRMPFYRVTYSNKSHIKYESNIKYLVQQGKWLDALGLCVQLATEIDEENDRIEGIGNENKIVFSPEEVLFLGDLIKEYAGIAVCQHSIFVGEERRRRGGSRYLSSQSDSHYQLAAQVSIQYCVALQLKDILFSEIYEIFKMSSQENIFLRALASCVVAFQQSAQSALRSLPLNVINNMEKMADNPTSHLSPLSSFSIPLLERCILSLDMRAQAKTYGIGSIPEMMLKHNLISGYLVASTGGGTDCVGAFRSAFDHNLSAYCRTEGISPITFNTLDGDDDDDSTGQMEQIDGRAIGYKLLLFLSYTLSILRFPTGQPSEVPVPVRVLLDLLIEVVMAPTQPATTSDSFIGRSPVSERESDPRKYLRALAGVDREALLHSLSVGLHNVTGRAHRETVRSLYVHIFEFARDSNSLEDKSSHTQSRSMTAAYFHYCEVDLLCASFMLPMSMVLAFIEYFALRFSRTQTSLEGCHVAIDDGGTGIVLGGGTSVIGGGGCEGGGGGVGRRAEESLCRLVTSEIFFSVTDNYSCNEECPVGRFDTIRPCLLGLKCHRAALLYEAGRCHARGGVYSFDGDLIEMALSHFTGTTGATPTQTTPHYLEATPPYLEVFRYLLTLANILSGERIICTPGDLPEAVFERALMMATCPAPSADPSSLSALRGSLSRYLVDLTLISMSETKVLVSALFACDIPLLISATETNRLVQFELLGTMISQILDTAGNTEVPSTPAISPPVFLKYFSLLLTLDPEGAYPFLSRCTLSGCYVPSKECLALCTNVLNTPRTDKADVALVADSGRGVDRTDRGHRGDGGDKGVSWCLLDAVSFLKEISSDLTGAIASILLYISLASKEKSSERRGKERTEIGREKEMERAGVSHGVHFLIRLCGTESSRKRGLPLPSTSPGDEAHWYSVLDSLLGILGRHKGSAGLDRFVAAMRREVTPRGVAEYILRAARRNGPASSSSSFSSSCSSSSATGGVVISRSPIPRTHRQGQGGGQEQGQGPLDPLQVACFRGMVCGLMGVRGGVYQRGLLSSIAICRGDLEILSRASFAERKKGRRYSSLSPDQSNKENMNKKVKEESGGGTGPKDLRASKGKSRESLHIDELREKFRDLRGRFLDFPYRFTSCPPPESRDSPAPTDGDTLGGDTPDGNSAGDGVDEE